MTEARKPALEELRALLDSGAFHHATYRNQNTLWEGLYIYARDANGCRQHLSRVWRRDCNCNGGRMIRRERQVYFAGAFRAPAARSRRKRMSWYRALWQVLFVTDFQM